MRRERALHSGDIDLEILRIGRDLDEFAAVVGHKDLIFREIRGDCDEFGIFYGQRAEDGDKGRSRAAGEEDVLRADRIAAALRQIVGNGLLGLLRAACGRVAMQGKAVAFQKLADDGGDLLRRGYGGIAERIVIDIFLSDDGCLTETILEQLADAGLLFSQMDKALRDHPCPSFPFTPFKI